MVPACLLRYRYMAKRKTNRSALAVVSASAGGRGKRPKTFSLHWQATAFAKVKSWATHSTSPLDHEDAHHFKLAIWIKLGYSIDRKTQPVAEAVIPPFFCYSCWLMLDKTSGECRFLSDTTRFGKVVGSFCGARIHHFLWAGNTARAFVFQTSLEKTFAGVRVRVNVWPKITTYKHFFGGHGENGLQ